MQHIRAAEICVRLSGLICDPRSSRRTISPYRPLVVSSFVLEFSSFCPMNTTRELTNLTYQVNRININNNPDVGHHGIDGIVYVSLKSLFYLNIVDQLENL